MAEDKTPPKAKKTYDKRKLIICAVCLIVAALGIVYIWHKNAQKQQQATDVSSAVAIVDVDELLPQHPNYVKMLKLQDEKLAIQAKLESYILTDESQQPPKVNPAPDVFAQVVEQQDNLRSIKMRQQLKEESVVKENELRSALAEEKNKVIQKINDKYYNAILNATIKLDNADNLRLSQQERENLLEQLDYLKKQRGMAVYQVEQQFNARVAKELIQWRTQRESELGINNLALHEADAADSAAKQQLEEQRDGEYLKDRMQMLQARKNDSERLLILLHTKDNEIKLLKKSMLKDIAGKATKIAVQKHLKLVISNVPMSFDFFGDPNIDLFDDKFLNGTVIGVDAIDITADVLQELQNDQAKNADK